MRVDAVDKRLYRLVHDAAGTTQALFPNYYIRVTDVLEEGETCALFGSAGSFKQQSNANWHLPAAWKVTVRNGQVSRWQVYADTKIPFEIIEQNSPA